MRITRTELNDLIETVVKEQNLSKNKRKVLGEVNKLINELLKIKQKTELLRSQIQNLETGSFQDEDEMLNSYNIALQTIERSLYQLNVLKQSLPRS